MTPIRYNRIVAVGDNCANLARTKGDAGDVVRLVLKSEHIGLEALAFLHLAKTGDILFESTDLRMNQLNVPPPDGHRGLMGLLMPISPGLCEEVHKWAC